MTPQSISAVMVVDDDPDVIAQMQKIFHKINVPLVKTFLDCYSALKFLEEENFFDFVFIDLRMPVMSGSALIQYIKNHENRKIKELYCVPILGNVLKEDMSLMKELGYLEAVTKPIAEQQFLKRLQEIIGQKENPESDRNFDVQFSNALFDKKHKVAEQLLLPKIKKQPNSLKYMNCYAELLFRAKQEEKAEDFLNKILKIDANFLPAINMLSKIYIKSKRFDDAMLLLDKAKSMSPQNIERMLVSGEMHLGAGRPQDAEESFKGVLKLNPNDEKAVFGLGRALATQGKVEESKLVLSTVQKGTELASFFNNKGVLLVRAQKYEEGISLYKNAVKVMDDKEREHLLLFNIGLAYFKSGDLDNALDYAKKSKEKAQGLYEKANKLVEKLQQMQGSGSVPAMPSQPLEESKSNNYLLTGEQMEFIMGGFDEDPKPEEKKTGTDDGFITFGLE